MSQEVLFVLEDFAAPYDSVTVEVRYERTTGVISFFTSGGSLPANTPHPVGVGNIATYRECGAIGYPATSLVRFQRIENEPYAAKLETENSSFCEIISCDLLIITPVGITPASSFFSADGSLTITATSSYNNILYSIDNVNFQSSNVFSGLSTGSYTIYAKDEKNCTYQVEVFVPVLVSAAAYGERFRITYDDDTGLETRISVFKEDYTGAVETVKAAGNPLSITMNRRNDGAFEAVKSCVVDINLIAQSDFVLFDLYADRWNENRVEIYKNNQLYHKTWIVASEYSEAFSEPPYAVKATATDLGLLKKIRYENLDGTTIKGRKTLLEIILFCLNQLNYELPLWENLNLYEERHDKTASDSPLTQTYYDTETLAGKNCYEVLTTLLTPFRARIFQFEAAWHIQQADLSTRGYTRRQYDKDGAYVTSENVDLLVRTKDGTSNEIKWLDNSARLDVEPALQRLTVTQELQPDTFIAKGFEKSDFIDANTLDGWTGTASILREVNEEGKYNVSILGNATSYANAKIIETRKPYHNPTFNETALVILKFKWFVEAPTALDDDNNKLYFNLRFEDNAILVYLTVTEVDGVFKGSFGNFLDPENHILFKGNKANTWNSFEVQIPIENFTQIGDNSDLILTLRQGVQTAYLIDSVKFKELEVKYLPFKTIPEEEIVYVSENLPRRYIVNEELTVEAGDAIVQNNAKNTFKTAFTLADGSITQQWSEVGIQTTKPLVELLTEKRYEARKTTKQRLSGRLNTNFPFTGYLIDPNLPSQAFLPVYVQLDDRRQFSSFEGIENPTNPPVCNSALPSDEMYLNNENGFRMRWQKNGELYCWTTQKTV